MRPLPSGRAISATLSSAANIELRGGISDDGAVGSNQGDAQISVAACALRQQ